MSKLTREEVQFQEWKAEKDVKEGRFDTPMPPYQIWQNETSEKAVVYETAHARETRRRNER